MARASDKKHRGVYEKVPGSGVWWIRYVVEGRIRREKAGGKQAAIDLYRVRKGQAQEGRLPVKERSVPFDGFVQEYLETARARLRSFATVEIHARRWIKFFGSRPLRSILPLMIERYVAQCEQEVAPATVNRELAFVKRVFAVAMENGLVERNPAKAVKFLREPSGVFASCRTRRR